MSNGRNTPPEPGGSGKGRAGGNDDSQNQRPDLPDHVHESRSAANEAAREKGRGAKVKRKKVNGRQRWVVEKVTEERSTNAVNLEVRRDDV